MYCPDGICYHLTVYSSCTLTLNNKSKIDFVYIHLAKAFDSVSHDLIQQIDK